MKISDVEAINLRQPEVETGIADGSQSALIVRVHTDEGVVGVGEVDSHPTVAKAVIDAPPEHKMANGLRAILLGEDPADIERLWEQMYERSMYFGRRGVTMHAISAVDIALWDIAGQVAGVPVHALLGGARRERVPAYASTLMPDTPEEAARVTADQVAAGFRAVKLGWGPLGSDPDLDIALVAAAREAGGDDFELIIDIGKGWRSARHAIDQVRRMEPYRPTWVEEPLPPDDIPGYAQLADAVETPIATGEEESTRWDFKRLVEEGRVDVVQPDVTRCGGITEWLRIAHHAREAGRRVVPHAWSTGIIKAASMHVLAVVPETEFLEYCVQETALNEVLVAERFPVAEDGTVEIPTAPGLGVTIDEDVLEEYRVDRGER
jgi:L-rhamnonate dehydratase